MFGSLLEKEPIFENFGDRKTSFYVVFFIPLTVSLIDVYLVWLEKKTGIPMKPISKYMIYGSWLVSVVYYSTIVFNHL